MEPKIEHLGHGNSLEFDARLPLSERLKIFKRSQFEPDNFIITKCNAMSEKDVKNLNSYLVELKKASAEEMRKSVYANYSAFIRTSKEITDLEGQILSMRNLLSSQVALVHGLSDGIFISSASTVHDDYDDEDTSDENRHLSETERWFAEFLDNLEVLLAERRVNEALNALDEAENVIENARDKRSVTGATFVSLQTTINEQRQRLVEQIADHMVQHSTRTDELRLSVVALKKLGDGPRAHTLMLSSHSKKLQTSVKNLNTTTTTYGGAYITALSQVVFRFIAQAASDSLETFRENPAYTSELVTWAVKQTEDYAVLLKRHVLASAAAAGSLRVAAECIHICLGHCSLLESRGLCLSSVLLRLFRPFIEQALSCNIKRIEQSSNASVVAEDWFLLYPTTGARLTGSTSSLPSLSSYQPKLSSSAQRFNLMVQELLEDMVPLQTLHLDGVALDGILQVFNSYVNLLIHVLPGAVESEEEVPIIVSMAETEAQQMALLANASLLADELLPHAAMKLLPLQQGQTNKSLAEGTPKRGADKQSRTPDPGWEWKKRLQRSVEKLRDSFCRLHALDLIFTEDGDTRLNAQMYTSMDGVEPEWFPSPIFQELFAKLTRMANISVDMFVGRERFATILLMRLTETVILWLSDDQNFWAEIEEGTKPLGPLGLQQFYLDMQFVLFASQAIYQSRHLHLHQVIKDFIARAIEAVNATGIDPYSVLPEHDWFAEVAQIAIKMLSGKGSFDNVEDDGVSPTHSMSGKSPYGSENNLVHQYREQ